MLAELRDMKNGTATGNDHITIEALKAGEDTTSKTLAKLYTKCLSERRIATTWKNAKMMITFTASYLNDYRPVALTSVVMKTLERFVLQFLKSIIDPLLDQFQVAYRNNRSVDDAVAIGLFYVLKHLDSPNTYARILFVDFSSA